MLRKCQGVTLIELMIALVILAVLVGMGVPAFQTMMRNYQIRTAAESIVSGLQNARNEAVRRNLKIRFQLVDSLDNQCDLLATGPNWVISRNAPTAQCDLAETSTMLEPNDTAQPQILQKGPFEGGTATMSASSGGAPAATVIFNSLGRALPGSIDTIDITNPAGGACEHVDPTNGVMRCMRVRIGGGGQVKMCDPKVSDTTDSRYCQ